MSPGKHNTTFQVHPPLKTIQYNNYNSLPAPDTIGDRYLRAPPLAQIILLRMAVTTTLAMSQLTTAQVKLGADGGSSPLQKLQKLQELPPEQRAAVQLTLADSRWDEGWLEAHRADRALTEGMTATGHNQRGPRRRSHLSDPARGAQALMYGTVSTGSHARLWLATADTMGSRRFKTAP